MIFPVYRELGCKTRIGFDDDHLNRIVNMIYAGGILCMHNVPKNINIIGMPLFNKEELSALCYTCTIELTLWSF